MGPRRFELRISRSMISTKELCLVTVPGSQKGTAGQSPKLTTTALRLSVERSNQAEPRAQYDTIDK